MGISGLLPLLKSIQVNKHLSDFAGQTLAVDAYVWLHRGVYACATELATGKKTTKYVDYAMHKVRLLRHHKIQPYVVFDGGPLPAKKGTESERRERREDNLAKANALASQGKHSQAREFYVKCVDVTPQMAYQLIKVLRAEGIQYVVAPYEADAQMAYLERIGIVDGVITEDSDLLVFGCRKVLFKLDSVSSTITSISRADFGTVTTADAGISLLGWTDSQFRAMAILSGCDYLPSIPGVGLKTAWTLLRKHRTVDQLVRALRLEGKKAVPKGYLEAFDLAEKVFLHQRVYCPLDEKLVCLTEIAVEDVMDAETEAYIGSNLEPSLAKKLADGNLDPITLLPIVDINPGFVPRVSKSLPLHFDNLNRPSTDKGKGKAKVDHGTVGLLHLFSPVPRSGLSRSNSAPTRKTGRNSGKRTLCGALDEDLAAKRIKTECTGSDMGRRSRPNVPRAVRQELTSSTADELPEASSTSQMHHRDDLTTHGKENIDPCRHLEGDLDEPPDPIHQEDGYMSPPPSYFRLATPDLSSPMGHPFGVTSHGDGNPDDFGADIISSPLAIKRCSLWFRKRSVSPREAEESGKILVRGTPPLDETDINGPDLKDILGACSSDEVEELETSETLGAMTHSRRPGTVSAGATISQDLGSDICALETRMHTVANGWWNKWAMKQEPHPAHKLPTLRRLETTVTPDGKQSGHRSRPWSAPPNATGPRVLHAISNPSKALHFSGKTSKLNERHVE
ncbi:PIN domain-like protein [Butyriboletus roseoflavus]|nr:PIN domain-like protein [Butyriboletus roseoflavus]